MDGYGKVIKCYLTWIQMAMIQNYYSRGRSSSIWSSKKSLITAKSRSQVPKKSDFDFAIRVDSRIRISIEIEWIRKNCLPLCDLPNLNMCNMTKFRINIKLRILVEHCSFPILDFLITWLKWSNIFSFILNSWFFPR